MVTQEECKIAVDSGLSSIMFDGSKKLQNENIDQTAKICEFAHAAGVSCEEKLDLLDIPVERVIGRIQLRRLNLL